MSWRGLMNLSLAAKCRLLFGLAVVLIIAAALFVPWYSLETLVHDRNFLRARHLALLARAQLDPANRNWAQQQLRLDQWWEDHRTLLRLSEGKPRLILLPPPVAMGRPRERVRTALQGLTAPLALLTTSLTPYLRPPAIIDAAWSIWRSRSSVERTLWLADTRQALLRVIFSVDARGQLLDDFQRRAAKEMTLNESINELQVVESLRDRPSVYRVILGVRGEETGSGRRPLVGLIDLSLDVPSAHGALIWTRVVIVLAGLLAGLLAILVFYLIVQKFILAPVRELTVLAGDIAGGNLAARADMQTGDEFEDLGQAFNHMLSQLEKSRVELEKINRSLDTRLGELAETNVALYESNRLKSEFLANVSHELRTPLTSIIGFADLLRDHATSGGEIDRARFARYAHNILTSGRGLLDLINDLLDLAKIEAGRVELHRTAVSVADICEALRDFMQPLADKKQLTLMLAIEEGLPTLTSDGGKIRQILFNLLSNAVKYTPEGGRVELSARQVQGDEWLEFAVSDTGPGIAPEDQEHIFEKFRQLDASVTRQHGGSGLGLAISRELCLLLGGSIRVESEPGRGSRFYVTLPVICPEMSQRAMPSLT